MENKKLIRAALVMLGVSILTTGCSQRAGDTDTQPELDNTSLHTSVENSADFSDNLLEKYGATFTPTPKSTISPTEETTIEPTPDTITVTPVEVATEEPTEVITEKSTEMVSEEPTKVVTEKPVTTPVVTEEPTSTPAIEEPTPLPVNYAVNDFSEKENDIIMSSTCSMRSLNSFPDWHLVKVPEKYKELNDRVFHVLDNKLYSTDGGRYPNIMEYEGCVQDWREYTKWFQDAYRIKLMADEYNYHNKYDHVNLAVVMTSSYNGFEDISLTQYLDKNKQDYDNFILFAKKTINMLGIDSNTREIDALWKIHNYIIDNYSYDRSLNSAWLDTMISKGVGICNGYALMLKLLARECGIDNNLFICKTDVQIKHALNIITLHDGNKSVQMLIDSTNADLRGDDHYLFGVSISSGIHNYNKRNNCVAFDVVDYNNAGDYLLYATHEIPASYTFTIDKHGEISVTDNADEMEH